MKVIVAVLAGLLSALASVSANATFIYLNHGASASQSAVAEFASNIAGIAAAAAQGNGTSAVDSQATRSGDARASLSSSSEHSALRRAWIDAFSVPTQRQQAENSTSGAASAPESIGADSAVAEDAAGGTAAEIAESIAQAFPAAPLEIGLPAVLSGDAAPQVTLETIAADLGTFTDASLVGGQAQGVPEPSTLGMLGFGLLGVFAVARRRSRQGAVRARR